MPELKHISLIRPSLQTQFHIDFEWWSKSDRNWHIHLRDMLCPQHREIFSGSEIAQQVDWIDPETAEVQRVDGIQHVLITHCSLQPDFITQHTTLVDAVFRLFLSNGNTPLTPVEMAARLQRPAEIILRTLSGGRIYRGMRPLVS